MSKCLFIGANHLECESLAAFGQKLELPYDIVCFIGNAPTDLGAGTCFEPKLNELPTAESVCESIKSSAENYSIIATASTMFGKDFMPRLAAMLNRPMVGDVLAVENNTTFIRPMYAGNILAKVHVNTENFCATIRTTSFTNPIKSGNSNQEPLSMIQSQLTKRIGVSQSKGGRPDLSQAKVVVSGGRPLKDSETFEKLIGGLADKLGGAAGATRAAVDSGIAPNDTQVGQTGKIVAPTLYIAAGVSGSTQHIAGMKDSKTIVAINTDAEAPIFEIADFGLVQDLYIAIPELMEKLP